MRVPVIITLGAGYHISVDYKSVAEAKRRVTVDYPDALMFQFDAVIEPVASRADDVYNQALAKLNELLGDTERGTLCGDLHNAAQKSLLVFRAILTAALWEKTDFIGGVDFGVSHANDELHFCEGALRRAREAIDAETPPARLGWREPRIAAQAA